MKPGREMPLEPGELCQELPAALPDATGLPGCGVKLTLGVSNHPAPVPTSAKSWVIWLKDGRYSYAWGETQTEAWANWLKGFGEGVSHIVPAGDYKSALPVAAYLREMNG